jgi:hypothetical protein
MNGYERLSFKEADLVWDREVPDEEIELMLDELYKTIESETSESAPCELFERCGDCPHFEDCYGISALPAQVEDSERRIKDG